MPHGNGDSEPRQAGPVRGRAARRAPAFRPPHSRRESRRDPDPRVVVHNRHRIDTEPGAGMELHYPFEHAPPQGEPTPVAEGVYWLRMPLPFSLAGFPLRVCP